MNLQLFLIFNFFFFWHLTQKFKIAAKKLQENDFQKKSPVDSGYPGSQTFFQNHSISHHFRDKLFFLFYAEIQDGRQKWQTNYFWEKSLVDSPDTLWVKNFITIAPSRTVSKINVLLHFMQNFKMSAKNDRKMIFWKSHQ